MTNNETTTTKPRARGVKDATTSTQSRMPVPAAMPSKSDTVIKLLLRTKGATPLELIAATDWQPHSVRAFLSGLRKKGRVLVREPRKSGEAAYRIVVAVPSPAATLAEVTEVAAGGGVTAGAANGAPVDAASA